MRARSRRIPGVLALVALLVAPVLPGAADSVVLAHAQLVASSPGAGSIVEESPGEIRLVFSEPLESQLTSLDVVDVNGVPILTRVGEIDPADPYALVVADPQLPDGVFRLAWRTLSAADGHTAEGFFNFGVGDVPGSLAGGPQGMTHTETDAPGVIGRWLTYIGLLLALGVSVFHRLVIRDEPMPARLVRLLAGGLLLSAAATLTVAILASFEAGSVIEYLFGTRNGMLQTARAGIALAGGVALLFVAPRVAGAVAGATGLIGIILLVASGHTAAVPGLASPIGQVVHVAGAAIWIGGLAGLLALVRWPELVTSRGRRPEMIEVVPRFSALALVSIGLVVLTGVHAAWIQTGTLVPSGTEYGRTLLMKSAFAVGALALGGLNYLDGGRMMGWLDGFRSRITVEVMLVATVLVLTAALAITPPAEEAGGVAIEPVPDAFGEVAPDVTMEVSPGRPGVNRIVVTTIEAMAGRAALQLGLDNLTDGTATLVPLALEGMSGMDHTDAGIGMSHEPGDGTLEWTADALTLPAGSAWDASVRVLNADEVEIWRQRFAFALDDDGIDEGQVTTLLDPVLGIAAALLLGGALGLGLGLGGARLPRCESLASRIALIGGGAIAAALGVLIGLTTLIG